MAPIRLLGCVALLSACYPQASYDSTMPAEPTLIAGPPGGGMDPEWQPGYYGDQNDPGGAVTDDPGAATATVTDAEIDATLDAYGEWVQDDEYGYVWRPYTTAVGVDFTPYETCGSWVWTDAGWTFACEWDWGWLPFHYGRWGWFDDYWAWVPDYYWSPAWVEWRGGGGYIGWRPVAPDRDHRHQYSRDHRTGLRDHRIAKQTDSQWRFLATADFGKPRIRAHLFKEPLEGLRVTSPATHPPLVGKVRPVKVDSLMQGRFGRGPEHSFDRSRPQAVQDPRTGRSYQPPYTSPPGPARGGWRSLPPPSGWNGARTPTWSGAQGGWNPPSGGGHSPPPGGGQPPPSWSGGHAAPPSGSFNGGGHSAPPSGPPASWNGGHSAPPSGSFNGGGHPAPPSNYGGGGHSAPPSNYGGGGHSAPPSNYGGGGHSAPPPSNYGGGHSAPPSGGGGFGGGGHSSPPPSGGGGGGHSGGGGGGGGGHRR